MFSRILIPLLLLQLKLSAQSSLLYFDYNSAISVQINGQELTMPWTGGLNYVQAGEIDLDMDGTMDLLLFDRAGFRIIPLLRNPVNNTFQYQPSYINAFPALKHWVLLRDYDQDGRMDIFTSAVNGISVYRNTGSPAHGLSFSLVTPLLESIYNTNFPANNLFVSLVDIPAIEDIDGDGDLDILTFFILGNCVEYHRNMSVENGQGPGGLQFRLEDNNWGNFTESLTGNEIILNSDCRNTGGLRHSGSALLLFDEDGDGLKDLLLSDVSYPSALMLRNGGTSQEAQIVSYTANFPPAQPINLPIFPGLFLADVDGDGRKDLICSPNNESDALSQQSVHYYKNTGNGQGYEFDFQTRSLFQRDMLDLGEGARSASADLNGDGKADMLLFNRRSLVNGQYINRAMYCQAGLGSNPSFNCSEFSLNFLPDALNLKELSPALGDLNGDGHPDLVLGAADGHCYYFLAQNQGQTFSYQGKIIHANTGESHASPCLADINNDGRLDLTIGYRNGRINVYFNTGTALQPIFSNTPSISQLGAINTVNSQVSNDGYATPYWLSRDNSWHLYVGSEDGKLLVFHNFTPTDVATEPSEILFNNQFTGRRIHPMLQDFTGDGLPDLILGNDAGGLMFFAGSLVNQAKELSFEKNNIKIYPNPGADFLIIQNKNIALESKYTIYDATGRQQHRGLMETNETWINTSHLGKGMYFIHIETDRSIQILRWVKQ